MGKYIHMYVTYGKYVRGQGSLIISEAKTMINKDIVNPHKSTN